MHCRQELSGLAFTDKEIALSSPPSSSSSSSSTLFSPVGGRGGGTGWILTGFVTGQSGDSDKLLYLELTLLKLSHKLLPLLSLEEPERWNESSTSFSPSASAEIRGRPSSAAKESLGRTPDIFFVTTNVPSPAQLLQLLLTEADKQNNAGKSSCAD